MSSESTNPGLRRCASKELVLRNHFGLPVPEDMVCYRRPPEAQDDIATACGAIAYLATVSVFGAETRLPAVKDPEEEPCRELAEHPDPEFFAKAIHEAEESGHRLYEQPPKEQ